MNENNPENKIRKLIPNKSILIVPIVVFIIVLLTKPLADFYVSWLWFASEGFLSVFTKSILTKISVGAIFFAVSFGILYLNLQILKKFKSSDTKIIKNDILAFDGKPEGFAMINKAIFWVIIFVAISTAMQGASHWDKILAFFNQSSFGLADPIFAKDVAFYIFTLPILNLLSLWLGGIIVFAVLISLAYYIFCGNLQYNPGVETYMPQKPKTHLFILLGLFFFQKGFGYFIKKFTFLFKSQQGYIEGVSYTLDKITIPAYTLMLSLSVVIGIMCLIYAFRDSQKDYKIPVFGFIAIIVIGLLGTSFIPSVVQSIKVRPNEITLEKPYIENNITLTRKAFNVDNIKAKNFMPKEDLVLRDINKNKATLDNVRLWDYKPLLATFSQLQDIRTYYSLHDVDNDRYTVNGKYRQVMISARELDYSRIPNKTWVNEKQLYTHGYGLVMGFVNEFTPEGLPNLKVKNIPPTNYKNLKVDIPQIYFGELSSDYVAVNTKLEALDYPSGNKNISAEYKGTGGIEIKSLFRKLIFALKYQNFKILFSTDITASSRFLINRNIKQRVRTVAPFLTYDQDPYIVLSEGKIYWIIDAFTTSKNFPYSSPVKLDNKKINYIRNSVKIVVDAYNGTMEFFVNDKNDPIVETYSKIFPKLFKPMSEMNADLVSHLRYPQTLFSVQAAIYQKYHMQDAQVFYNQEDLWTIPKQIMDGKQIPMVPYYTIMKFPDSKKEEYILMLPYTPSQKDNMIAWMAARSDAPNVGELMVYQFPKEKLIYGPMQIEARIDQDPVISQQFKLWERQGSRIIRGSLMVIPVKDSLLYIEPIYLQAEISKIPELRRIIVAYGEKIAMEKSLDEALIRVITGSKSNLATNGFEFKDSEDKIASTSKEALNLFNKAQQQMRNGDYAGYGETIKQLSNVLNELAGANAGE
ncbi:MAG: UPF0182 family protein [Elusimicrobiaceae bacterium]|jgi:uncharacterized protein|nr:UPF0182 family protein [Elusimicrobiaceae bacterium]MBT3955663.1 UPF0182 family protein [Elusimicrobiaceae bacterium]MBT4403219.1 UPF0182 family protein [Elusimicrobiaceae bacterium]MBT4439813.1 UPF0182 family protein [Elusimicrobiaceae bacterium]MBT5987995.1 UPF0182 family protein [Elusimicrobiaceae bacterium]